MIHRELERVSLEDLVADAIAGVSPVATAKGVRLEGHVDAAPPDLEIATPDVIRALRNILENAIRHTDGAAPLGFSSRFSPSPAPVGAVRNLVRAGQRRDRARLGTPTR